MRILHIVDTLEVGGAEVLVVQLCRMQQESGCQPRIHCLLRKGPLATSIEAQGIPVSLSRAGRYKRYVDMWNLLRSWFPDVVHCHNANATIQAAPLARLAGISAVITTRHGLVSPEAFRGREIKFWMAARFCDRVVAVCQAAFDNLVRGPGANPRKIRKVMNGAAPAPQGTERPGKTGFTLITVARLTQVKNQAGLLEAVAIARGRVSGLKLRIIGDGPMRDTLNALADRLGLGETVEFLGERADVGSWLQAADVFVLSSLSEGLPVSVLEAMAAGLPLLVTRVGGMPEILDLAAGGLAVPPSDTPALSAAIVDLWQRRAELPRMGEANRKAYAGYLTPEKMFEQYQALYNEVLRPRRRLSNGC